ncbi:MAG: hypothetical protein ACTHMM_05610 [Agriterribacter sp.]
MKAEDIKVGMRVTLLSKGAAFANTTVKRKYERYGSTYVNLDGVLDDFGDLSEVHANEIKPLTQGWYSTNPNKTAV